MAKKYYAVRAGRKTGIFETWDESRSSKAFQRLQKPKPICAVKTI